MKYIILSNILNWIEILFLDVIIFSSIANTLDKDYDVKARLKNNVKKPEVNETE